MPPDQDDLEWSDADLLRTARDNYGTAADYDLPDGVRFVAGVTQLVLKRIAHAGKISGDPALFFLLPGGPKDVDRKKIRVEPMLDNGLTDIGGALWFVGPPVVLGHRLPLPATWDDAAIFDRVGGELGLGDVPAVLIETRTISVSARYYPRGLGSPEKYQELTLSAAAIQLDDVIQVVDGVYAEMLVTPLIQSSVGKLWADQSKHWPSSSAEGLIQLHLRAGLKGQFPSCTIRAEQTQATGRLDLEIEEASRADPSVITRHGLLELKVLRSYGSGGKTYSAKKTREAIEEGVTQAAAYGTERGARFWALFCFDMRLKYSGQKCFAHVAVKAKKLKVALRAWHLFASVPEYRAVIEKGLLATASGAR